MVENPVRLWLRLEGLLVVVTACLLFDRAEYSWALFALLFLAPDLSLLAYLAGPRIGSVAYNVLHSYIGPLLLAVFLLFAAQPTTVPLIWIAHIGFDRLLGFGLKYPADFGISHLGHVRRRKSRQLDDGVAKETWPR